MDSTVHCCVVCQKRITWRFWLCSECEAKYGNSQQDPRRPEWVRFLVREAARERRADVRDTKFLSDLQDSDTAVTIAYPLDIESLVMLKMDFAGWMYTSDGEAIAIQDSDWDAVFDWSV